MTYMNAAFASAFLAAASASAVADDAAFTMSCHNPPLSPKVTKQGTNAGGVGRASSQSVQVNVNRKPSGKRVLWTDAKNAAVCVVTVSGGYRITKGWGVVHQTNIHGEITAGDASRDPAKVLRDNVLLSNSIQEVDTTVFTVRRKDDGSKGTVNVNFFVEYQRAQ